MESTQECTVGALLTVRDIARECSTRVHRVKYVIDELAIEPRQWAGNVRLWSRDQLPEIKAGLERTAAGRRALIPTA
jgi:hypothetical protein